MKKYSKIFISLLCVFAMLYAYGIYSLSNKILVTGSSHEQTKERFISYWNSPIDSFLALVPEPETHLLKGYENIDLNLRYFNRFDHASCVIIMSHGWSQDWAGMLKFLPALSDCKCDYVLYDMRSHGESGGPYPTGGIKESEDLLRVTDWVKREKKFKSKQIGWVGSSWGAGASLMAGSDPDDIAFIIVDAPFTDWTTAIFERAVLEYGEKIHYLANQVMGLAGWRAGVDYEQASSAKHISKISEPIMIIHSQTDSETNSRQSVLLSKQMKHDKSIFHHINWGGDHSRDVYLNRDKYKVLVNDFLMSIDTAFVNP